MLRFLPDGLLEGLLRPFLMIDPAGYLYVEMMAPDWRLALFSACARDRRRCRAHQGSHQRRAAAARRRLRRLPLRLDVRDRQRALLHGLAAHRRPAAGAGDAVAAGVGDVALAGPRRRSLCPGVRPGRLYTADSWGLARWVRGPGIDIEASPLQTRPAIFLSISSLTYSILVPRFDPRSRWANIAGQVNIRPGTKEYPRLIAMLNERPAQYVVLPVVAGYPDATQPDPAVHDLIVRSLAPFDLELDGAACETLRSSLAPGPIGQDGKGSTFRGFWFCPITRSAHTAAQPAKPAMQGAPQLADVFARVEQRCPRFFPPAAARSDIPMASPCGITRART